MTFRLDPIWSSVLRGCAYGDAWGNRNEFQSYSMLTYDDPRGRDLPSHLVVTDDTQMTLSLARALNGAGRKSADQLRADIITEFVLWRDETDSSRVPGQTCLQATANLASGLPWTAATVARSDGCGTVMRVSPAAFLPEGLWQPVAAWQAALTHGAAAGIATCLLAAAIIRRAAGGQIVPDGRVTTAALELASDPSLRTNVASWLVGHPLAATGADLAQFIDDGLATVCDCLRAAQAAVPKFRSDPWGDDPCAWAGQGWRAQENLATALLCIDALPGEPVEALRRATVTGGDSDSIAAVAGAILGALSRDAWPQDWFDRLEARYRGWIAEAESYSFG
jgi:ADP-ribosylglycohydrolase